MVASHGSWQIGGDEYHLINNVVASPLKSKGSYVGASKNCDGDV